MWREWQGYNRYKRECSSHKLSNSILAGQSKWRVHRLLGESSAMSKTDVHQLTNFLAQNLLSLLPPALPSSIDSEDWNKNN